jgi:hypothetical protein
MKLHGVTFQKTVTLMYTSLRTSYLANRLRNNAKNRVDIETGSVGCCYSRLSLTNLASTHFLGWGQIVHVSEEQLI